jgi:phospholipase/lecithinase/hemolysin
VETKRGFRGTGVVELGFLCNRLTKTCEEASEYLFWDAIHPSLAAYQYIAKHVEDKLIPMLLL